MRTATLTVTVGLVASLAAPAAGAQTLDRSEADALVSWINTARAARHLAPLRAAPELNALAEGHSVDMARQGYFSHSSPTTGAVEDRAATAGVRWRSLGENIAFNQSVRAAHDALMRSPDHYANITGAYRSVGVGLVRTGEGVFVTEVFATFVSEPPRVNAPQQPQATRVPEAAPQAPGVYIPWGWSVPTFPEPRSVPTAPERGQRRAQRGDARRYEVDTPFGHLSVTVMGGGIDVVNPTDGSEFPNVPDGARRSPRPAPGARPERRPSTRTVPRVEVPPVPTMPQPPFSVERLGAPTTI